MSSLRREVGFLKAVRETGLKSFMVPEGVLALLIACIATIWLCAEASVYDRLDVADASLRIIAPLLGVVLAALTFVISFASDDYLRHLKSSSSGVIAFYRPFIFAIGIEILTLILIVVYSAMAAKILAVLEYSIFGLMCFFVTYSILNVLAVARNVVMHALLRARLLED